MMKILVNTVDAWSRKTGSDTMSSLLSGFDSENVASINIRARKSDSKAAGRYFHILEGRVIRSIFHPSLITGEAYLPQDNGENDAELQQESRRYGGRHLFSRYFYVLIREILWKWGHWKSRQLDAFIEDFGPEVFFFPIESYIHFNRLNLYIIKKFKPKRVLGYMWDDNFTFRQDPRSPLYRLHRRWLRRSVKALIHECDVVFAICPKMKRELDAEFGIDSVLLTKPVRPVEPTFASVVSGPIRILYTGKLIIGRAETVAAIVTAIQQINKDGQKVLLDVYTDTPFPERMRKRIDVPGCCRLLPFIPQQEVFVKQMEADVLLFAESFSTRKEIARLSFSTKITDYLSAGKCIWAVGNADLAPIDYLSREDAALISESPDEILKVLRRMIENPQLLLSYARKAYDCGKRNHDAGKIHAIFAESLQDSFKP